MRATAVNPPNPSRAMSSASAADAETFQRLTEPYRRELQLHCYRMLGSIHDAEDLVQETFLRAWRGFHAFEGRSSVRNWLYRIATNICLNALESRAVAQRLRPGALEPVAGRLREIDPEADVPWLEPYPDAALEGVPDTAPGPEARYAMRESVHLAFVAAIQRLPPRQRAVVLLRDVLGWSPSETAGLLESTVASVNSALQRGRVTLGRRLAGVGPEPDERQRALLERYVRTWEDGDPDGFAAMLREDVVLSMPPLPQWYVGRIPVVEFFANVLAQLQFRVVLTASNRQPALAMYARSGPSADWETHAIQLLSFRGDAITRVTAFRDQRLFARFGLPDALPGEERSHPER